jgi:prevent-host-death family protein
MRSSYDSRNEPSKAEWQLQEAKNRFSEVFEKALVEGPQIVSRRGAKRVVIISEEEYNFLTHPKGDLVEFFQNSPFAGVDLDLDRNQDYPRDVHFGG